MSRAGREPAEDVKRRLVVACQEVGLTIAGARMHLVEDIGARVVMVDASVPGWGHETATVCVMALVGLTGAWPEAVSMRCVATDEDPVMSDGPWMRGRDKVPFSELIQQLSETLEERAQVIAAVKGGAPGPYRFERSVWEEVDLSV